MSYTPIGDGAAAGVTYKFLSEPSSDRAVFRITGQEAKHISPERREELASGYAEHERETRLEGIPQLGTGPVFPVELLPLLCKSFDVGAIASYTRMDCRDRLWIRASLCRGADLVGVDVFTGSRFLREISCHSFQTRPRGST